MSTTATTARAVPAKASLAASVKFRAFAITFSLVGMAAYLLCLEMNWPVFTFHPATNRVVWGWEASRSGEGPAMYWYGWTASTLIAAAVLGLIATKLPESTIRKIPLSLTWIAPLACVPVLVYALRFFWRWD
jgi:hypothetical protein